MASVNPCPDRHCPAAPRHHGPISIVRFQSALLRAGTFDVHPSHPEFEHAGRIPAPTMVFPKSSVWIQHEHEPAFPADVNLVTYYNQNATYLRRELAAEGDHCHWFEFAPAVVPEVVASCGPAAADGAAPFRFTHGPSDRAAYQAQQQLMRYLHSTSAPDPLYVEETTLGILGAVVSSACERQGLQARMLGPGAPRQRELVRSVQAVLAARFSETLSVREIARDVGTSVFHLCRVFKAHTGKSIHEYRNELRLRRALNLIPDTADLTTLALELGFSSHSHFTLAFRRAFGATPSQARQMGSVRRWH